MNKKIISLFMAIIMITCVMGCKKKDEQQETQKEINVTTEAVQRKTLNTTITNTGEIKPAQEISVTPKISGKIKSVNIDVGKYVNAGDVLFTIDDTDYLLQYNQAQAAYNSAQASYNSTVGGTQQQAVSQVKQAYIAAESEYKSALSSYEREKQLYDSNSKIIIATNTYNDAKTAYERLNEMYQNDTTLIAVKNAYNDAKSNYERTKELFNIGAVSRVALDSAKTAMENAEATLKVQENTNKTNIDNAKSALLQAEQNLNNVKINERASLDAAETRLNNAKEGVKTAQENYNLTLDVLNPEREAVARASVKSAKASLDISKNALNNTKVVAPISGYVTSCTAKAGQMAQQGTTSVGLIDINSVEVEFSVTESVISSIREGNQAVVSVPSANVSDINGTVTTLSPSKDNTGMYSVKINIPNADGVLKGGMFADVDVVTGTYDNVLCVPNEAVITDNDNSYVYIVEGNKAYKQTVVTGVTDGIYTEILSGLEDGSTIILEGKEYITDENNTIKIIQK